MPINFHHQDFRHLCKREETRTGRESFLHGEPGCEHRDPHSRRSQPGAAGLRVQRLRTEPYYALQSRAVPNRAVLQGEPPPTNGDPITKLGKARSKTRCARAGAGGFTPRYPRVLRSPHRGGPCRGGPGRCGLRRALLPSSPRSSFGPPAGAGRAGLLGESAGLRLYRLCDEQSGIYEYKIYCILDDCPPKLYVNVYMDLDYRKQWDKSVKELYEATYDGEKVIYWEVKYPYPLSNRDYVYIRECRELNVDGQKIWVVLAQSVSAPQCPEKPGVTRVQSYKQSLAIGSDGKTGSKAYMYYFDNPGGEIPSRLVNWIAKSGVPTFLKDMQEACHNYSKST
ncbi:LOW QUALITY PROTEIN: phosphatidylcholine transfer protein [Apus apus]|uniref:LOW QUALITY PROTEIN: phosphatidylcholine transfer protein n=1 Tax=Apus apus TaxID=8895 RepID=UPI0021F81E6C|nr:LOW QUALITY PROTEIN: phosphatidylcholine transfer protein [Apus apus]